MADPDDIEKGNYDYYLLEHEHTGCWSRFCHEFCQHPFTLLEVNGYVIDVQRTFAAKPSWFVVLAKAAITGVTMDVFVRDLLNYTGTPSFWLAYYANWATILTLMYLYMSLFNSLCCCGTNSTTPQPTAYENRASCGIAFTWCMWVLALSYQFLNFFSYWSLVFYTLEDLNSLVDAVSYFTVMKSFGVFALLIVEGQVLNRIPMRWAHLTIAELGFLSYLIWSLIHFASGMGNPDVTEGTEGSDSIYVFLNWDDAHLNETAAGCGITMMIVLPAIWFVFYVLSWPFRRYMPIDKSKIHDGAALLGDYDYDSMPEEIHCSLSAGYALGAVFDGNIDFPPTIKELSDDSQLHSWGVVPGMVVDTLEFQTNGTTYYEMTTNDLVEHLRESIEQDGRVLSFVNPSVRQLTPTPAIPDRAIRMPLEEEGEPMEVTLPAGKVGVVLTGQPPVVSRISEESPLVGTGITVGMWVDTLTVMNGEEDPVTHYEMEASELTQLLKDHSESEGRVVRFIPAGMELTKEGEGGEAMELLLPAGSIGLVFSKGTPPEIKAIKETSPLTELYPELQAGMFIDTLTLEDGTTHYNMNGKEFTMLLKTNKESDSRMVRVIPPGMDLTPETSNLPEEIVASIPPGPLMAVLEGCPPRIERLAQASPLHDFGVVPGMVIDTVELLEGGTKHYELSTDEVTTLLGDHSSEEGRLLRFINPDLVELTPKPNDDEDMPPEVIAAVPSGSLGIDVKGTPPKIVDMAGDSCLHDYGVVVGMVVDTIELEDSTKHYEMSSETCVELLSDNVDSEGRTLVFINPDLVDLTAAPVDDNNNNDGDGGMPLECEAFLPAGPLGVAFSDDVPPVITELQDDSCLHDYEVHVGMVVDTLTLGDGTIHYELQLNRLMDILQAHRDEDGKILRFVHPDHLELLTPQPPYDGPDEVTCTVPSGSLGCAFNGSPPVLLNLQDNSPLHDEGVVVGMKVDTIVVNGVKHYEMDHLELTTLLKDHQDSSSKRIIRFVAPHYVNTPPPIPNGIDISDDPDTLEIQLPCGKLGLSFTGTEPICIKTVRPDSELLVANHHTNATNMEGYGINRIYVPGHEPSEHLVQLRNMKEVMVVLTKTKNVSGRVMYLKKPELYPDGFDKPEDFEESAKVVEWNEEELECQESLLEMGFEEDAILSAMQYYRDLGQPIDTDDVMTRIITEGG